nr:MAG TPA: hypothetical protein [Bacteriophage sp.]
MSRKPLPDREEFVRLQPTVYQFHFKDVPSTQYAKSLDVLFHNPDYLDAVEKRNRIVETSKRMRVGTSEMRNLLRTIQQHDRRLADIMYATMVQTNLRSDVSYDFMNFSTLLKYYVDYSQPGMKEKVDLLASRLDRLTFLAECLDRIATDIRGNMLDIFRGNIEFNQFDTVSQVLHQLRGYFRSAGPKDVDSREGDLFYEYADSIYNYVDKRLHTFSAKYRKLHPAAQVYTEADLIEGLNQFFGRSEKFDKSFIKHTESGGCYIDVVHLCFNLDRLQTEKIEQVTAKMKSNNITDDTLRYSFNVTDLIMSKYKRPS